ncbi:MAG: endonuclease V [Chloroflexia bacterium]|nr:endonuclease V [Chloroflexia bacterium]
MILAIDVDYKGNTANAAGIVFKDWKDSESFKEYTVQLDKIKEYIPGQFYKRELPCLTALHRIVNEEVTTIIIDGFVWLSDIYKKGLGAYLYQKLDRKIPVIGVAKKSFYSLGENYREIYRGESKSPLFITSAGIDLDIAADNIKIMAGEHRLPILLKKVDFLCRKW